MAPCNSTRSVLASDAESLAARLEEQGVLRAGKVKCVGKVLPFEVPVQVLCRSTTGGRQVPHLGRHERELASWRARDGGSFLSQSRLLPPATCHLPPCRGRPMAWPRIAAVQCGQAGKNARGREGLQAGAHLGYSGSSTVRTGQHAGKYMGYVRWLQAWKKWQRSTARGTGKSDVGVSPTRSPRRAQSEQPAHRGPRRAPLACSRCPGRPVSGGRCGGRSSGGGHCRPTPGPSLPAVYSVPCPGPVAEGVARCREPNPDFEKNRPRQNPVGSPNKQTTAPPSPPQSIDELGMARSPSPVPPRYTHLRPSALAAGGRPLAGWPRHSTPRHGPVHAWRAECRSANRDGQPTSPRASSTS